MSTHSASGDPPVRSVEQITGQLLSAWYEGNPDGRALDTKDERALFDAIASALREARQQAFTAGWDAHYEWATHEWGPAPPETAEEAYKEWAASSGAQGEQG